MTQKEKYYYRKENHLCVQCGKTLEKNCTKVYCEECSDKRKNTTNTTRRVLQQNGICPRCGKNRIIGDEKQCLECNAKAYEYNINFYTREERNKQHAAWSKRTHHEMIEKGICTRCRKRKADNGFKTCGICRAKIRQYKRNKSKCKITLSERYLHGLCYFCDNPVKAGYKVCEEHYQKNLEYARSEKADKSRKQLLKEGVLW